MLLGCAPKKNAKTELVVDTWTNLNIDSCIPRLKSGLGELPFDLGFTTNRTDVRRYDVMASARSWIITQDLEIKDLSENLLIPSKNGQVGVQFTGFSLDGTKAYLHQMWVEPQHAMFEEAVGDVLVNQESYRYDLYAMDIATGGLKSLTDNSESYFHQGPLVFSGVPNELFYTARIGNENRLYRMNLDGSNKRPLADSAGYQYGLTFSPDGSKYAFHAVHGKYKVFIGDTRTGNEIEVRTSCDHNFSPIFSPDSSKIVFICDGNYFTARSDGNAVKYLGSRSGASNDIPFAKTFDHHGGGSDRISWMKDSSGIVHGKLIEGRIELVISREAGFERLTYSRRGAINVHSQVTNNGQFITYHSNKGDLNNMNNIYYLDLATKEEIQVTEMDKNCNTRYSNSNLLSITQ